VSAVGTIDVLEDDALFCKFCGRADPEVLTACPYFPEGEASSVVWILCADCIARFRALAKKPGSKLRVADVDMSAWGTA
jgi:hypothetical protein